MTRRDTSSRPPAASCETLHASCVAAHGRAALITGASGTGKSALALQLMAHGAGLVADDRTLIWRSDDQLWADAPDRLSGMIEAREVGILRVTPVGAHPLAVVIDLDTPETERLPAHHATHLSGLPIPVLRKSDLAHFPAAILTYLRGQREA
ncbi:MAG: HPr kinase/phosphatase C-terminal domain-containing protein [Pseudomonadota bacterium]